MWWLLQACVAWAPTYTRVSASDFAQYVWVNYTGTANCMSAANYFAADKHNESTVMVIRQAGEVPTGYNYTYYYVYGTKQEIAVLESVTASILDDTTDIYTDLSENVKVVFVTFEEQASTYQLSLFWVNIAVWAIVLAGAITGFLLWHFDGYAKDPGNSLLFVTDGNRIVTGE